MKNRLVPAITALVWAGVSLLSNAQGAEGFPERTSMENVPRRLLPRDHKPGHHGAGAAVVQSKIVVVSKSEPETPTLLAFGDSITQGGKGFPSYREPLIKKLTDQRYQFRFIGPNKDETSAHAGFGGRNSKQLRGMIEKLYRENPADIVLVHAGHNHFNKDKPVAGIIADTKAIVETLKKINPDAAVLLAQVIPAGKLPKYSYIPELNRELILCAKELAGAGHNVTLVDHATGFDWTKHTVTDRVHPNAAGAEHMANCWLRALAPLLSRSPDRL